MKYLSVCSGIEAASVAWHPLGWRAAGFSEIEAFPRAVLAHHWPDVPLYGDMTQFKGWPDADFDVLVGGTPCQSFSVAGLRKGLDDPRGNLMLTYLAIADRYRPEWLVWENVPGVLSIDGGSAFGALLGGLAQLGYGFAYRVLDAQFFGVAQRRRRVFVVGNARSWRRAAAVLSERASLRGDSAPRRKARQGTAGGTLRGTDGGSDVDHARAGRLIPDVAPTLAESGGHARPDDNIQSVGYLIPDVANPLTARMHKGVNTTADEGQTMIATAGEPFTLAVRGRGDTHDLEFRQDGVANALLTPNGGRAGIGVGAIAFDMQGAGNQTTLGASEHRTGALGTTKVPAIAGMQVRRLTPRECERLQGFPDDYTLIPYGSGMAKDGPRYKALGNSMAVPVMRWIGERIDIVDGIVGAERSA